MRNRVVVLALALAFILGITAQASGPLRQPLLDPGLTFSGTVATCKAEVYADKVSDQINVQYQSKKQEYSQYEKLFCLD